MKEVKVRMACKVVIIIGITIIGVGVIITHEGSMRSLIMLGLGFVCILLIALNSILGAYKEMLKEKIDSID